MAKITFGPIVSEARNKVGGVVYSRNTYGPYSRAFIVPPYTNTSAQAAARAALTALSQRWGSTLTDEQRAGWRSLGELYPHTDVFKQVNSRPGLQAYLRANLALASVGSSPVDTAPQNWHATDPGEITATAVSGTPPSISVNAANSPAIAEAVQIWVTPQQSPGANYFYRRLRLVATAPAGTPGPWDPSAGWTTRFTTLALPAKLGVGIRYVNVETGATGPMRTALITATEGGDILLQQILDLTHAQILTLPTTQVQLLPVAPAGFTYTPIAAEILGNIVANYTNIGDRAFIQVAPQLLLLFNDPVEAITSASQILTNAFQFRTAHLGIAPGPQYSTDFPGYAPEAYADLTFDQATSNLTVTCQNWDSPARNDLGNFTGGDPANKIRIVLFYALTPTP